MNVLVINPPAYNRTDFIREGRCMQTKSSWAALWMPLSLCYISSFLRNNNHQVKLVDCIAEKIDDKKLVEIAGELGPEIVILNTAIPSITGDMNTAAVFKRNFPDTKIIVVGMYPTIFGKECLENFPQVDYAIIDEPEWVSSSLVNALSRKSTIEGIKGLIFRKGSEIIVNERQNLSENKLDDLPFPARDLLNNEAYRLPTNGKKFTLLSVGRGCPENCIYCIANLYYGKRFRRRSVDSVVSEIEECVNKFDIQNFLLWGESFTTDPKYGEDICDEIIKRNIKIFWSTTTRADTLNPALLEKMKKAGCILLGLGIESYDQEILNNARKNITVEQIDTAVSMVRKAGINSMGHFIFGLPGDTRETARKTIKFACKNVDFAQFYCAIPYPGTELGRIAKEQKWTGSYDYEDLDLTRSIMGNESLSPKEIRKIRDSAYRKFYFRPKMILQTFKEVKSFKSFFSILNFVNWIAPKNS
jgi:anaerobic magnesium-protoporphyrin IX monomethyl ester cyclase